MVSFGQEPLVAMPGARGFLLLLVRHLLLLVRHLFLLASCYSGVFFGEFRRLSPHRSTRREAVFVQSTMRVASVDEELVAAEKAE